MPQDGVPPDLGPKMYNAYASNDEGPRGFGTTNLHNDMADAVNIMMFAGDRPEDMDDTGYEDDKIPGALWCIYPDDQSENIRNYLKEQVVIFTCDIV